MVLFIFDGYPMYEYLTFQWHTFSYHTSKTSNCSPYSAQQPLLFRMRKNQKVFYAGYCSFEGPNLLQLIAAAKNALSWVHLFGRRWNSWTTVLVTVSGHKLEPSQTRVFVWFSTLIFPFYKMRFMKRLEISCFADFCPDF